MGEIKANHIPAMLEEVMEFLDPKENDVVVDATLGLGGHAEAILKRIGTRGRLIGIDRDERSLRMAKERLRPYLEQTHFVRGDFRDLDRILSDLGVTQVNGVLLDFGISSFQLDDPQRGFSFQMEGPLDMRMDQDNPLSAFELVNSLPEEELAAILRDYGEERWHNRIARTIVRQRSMRPIATTSDLREVVLKAVPSRKGRGERIHPATRTFQAIRIAVNRELESIDIVLKKCVDLLAPGGRIAVIAFHSLEDRIVKQQFRALAQEGKVRLVVKKPLRPGEKECQENPRARSARLRIAERAA
jgi:16S rRNA (cytosine1402-N4)-methyltransferase